MSATHPAPGEIITGLEHSFQKVARFCSLKSAACKRFEKGKKRTMIGDREHGQGAAEEKEDEIEVRARENEGA